MQRLNERRGSADSNEKYPSQYQNAADGNMHRTSQSTKIIFLVRSQRNEEEENDDDDDLGCHDQSFY